MDFAFYRGLDPILGRWYGVDPEAEMYANMSPYCGMNNNPGNEVDPLGDTPAHVVAGLIGGGINVYNNWSKIVKNPWSAIGYAATGITAGVVSISGGAAAAAQITAVGNLMTDMATGNLPDVRSVRDAFNYVAESAGNALDVGGAGRLAKAGLQGLAKLGSEWAADAIAPFYETVYFNIVSESGITKEGISFTQILSYDTKQVLRLGAPSLGLGKISAGAVGGQLGFHGNSVNSPKPSGYYEIEFESGKKYHGVGDEKRMMQSANQKSLEYSDPIKSPNYTKTANRAEAYKLEAKGIDKSGGRMRDGGNTYNKINSPGKKLLKFIK